MSWVCDCEIQTKPPFSYVAGSPIIFLRRSHGWFLGGQSTPRGSPAPHYQPPDLLRPPHHAAPHRNPIVIETRLHGRIPAPTPILFFASCCYRARPILPERGQGFRPSRFHPDGYRFSNLNRVLAKVVSGLQLWHSGTWQHLPCSNLLAQHSHPGAMYVSALLNLVETSRITAHL